MREPSSGDVLEDAINIREVDDGRWAWVDDEYDGTGTRIVEWIEVTELATVVVHHGDEEHLQLNDNEFDGTDGFLSETRWLSSSRWVSLEESR
jgi:hypothetical protein